MDVQPPPGTTHWHATIHVHIYGSFTLSFRFGLDFGNSFYTQIVHVAGIRLPYNNSQSTVTKDLYMFRTGMYMHLMSQTQFKVATMNVIQNKHTIFSLTLRLFAPNFRKTRQENKLYDRCFCLGGIGLPETYVLLCNALVGNVKFIAYFSV